MTLGHGPAAHEARRPVAPWAPRMHIDLYLGVERRSCRRTWLRRLRFYVMWLAALLTMNTDPLTFSIDPDQYVDDGST